MFFGEVSEQSSVVVNNGIVLFNRHEILHFPYQYFAHKSLLVKCLMPGHILSE